ncbi:MAG: TetR family transcriptional regulator [Brevundimonas sp.]
MSSGDAQRIIDAAIEMVALQGFRKLTLRDLAQAVGKSTTVVVNLFGGKPGLILAIGEAALERDARFHVRFFASVAGLEASRDNLLAIIMLYLRRRAGEDAEFVRVWEALLLDAEAADGRRELIARWEAMRERAWRDYLAASVHTADFARVLAPCLVIEQFYAGALSGRADYEVVCAEGLGSLIDRSLGRPDGSASATFWFRDNLVMPRAPAEDLEADSMRLRLLDIAADQILTGGVASVTNRSVSLVAGTSTSTIAYHWPDMRHFVVDAVWHSVFRELPQYLAGRRTDGDPSAPTIESWQRVMEATLSINPVSEGFYIKYARLIASICLEARRDPALQDLAMVLRGPEGGGTFYNSADVWPPSFNLTRLAATRFALWIKGCGLIASATGMPLSGADLKDAAGQLVAQTQA